MLTLQVSPKRQAGYEFRTHRWKSSKEFRDSFLFVFASFFIYNSVKTYAVNKKNRGKIYQFNCRSELENLLK